MKIATYYVNGVNGRLEVLLRWLDEAKPDVVDLQELKTPDPKFPAKTIEAAGYGAVWHGQKFWNGVAILARVQEPHLTQADVSQFAIEEIERLRVANEQDPDPADDASEGEIEEPANDWPAAGS